MAYRSSSFLATCCAGQLSLPSHRAVKFFHSTCFLGFGSPAENTSPDMLDRAARICATSPGSAFSSSLISPTRRDETTGSEMTDDDGSNLLL